MDALMIFDQAGIGSNNGEVSYICPSEKTFWFVFCLEMRACNAATRYCFALSRLER
jgi:hypothetical protein